MDKDFISKPIEFEWDKGNSEKSYKKHGILNEETESVFFDEKSLLADDLKHSKFEDRFQIVGKSAMESLLTVFFTIRKDKIRIISARSVNRKERNLYENKKIKTDTKF